MFTIEKNVKFELWNFTPVTSLWKILITKNSNYPSKHSSWWGRLEDVLKTSFVFVFRRRLGQDQYIRLGHTSSRRLQDVFKTSSRHFSSSRHLQDVFKTSSRRLQKRLQDIFKTSCKDTFKMFWRRIVRLNCLPRSHFWEIYGWCRKSPRVISFSITPWFYFFTLLHLLVAA